MTPADAWDSLLIHQRDSTGFCRTCCTHWPCASNADAIHVLAAVGTREDTRTDANPDPYANQRGG